MNLLRQSDADFDSRLRAIAASSSLFDEGIEQRTRDVIRAVASRGDDALT